MAAAIPKDSLVLVTGVNSYIANHVADQLMEAEYRGLSALLESKFGKDRFEFVTVTVMSHDGVFGEAIKGTIARVSGVAHVASNTTFDPDLTQEFSIDTNTWNEACIKEACAPPPYSSERAWAVYTASKTGAEKAFWKGFKEQKPAFATDSILPNINYGTILANGEVVTTAKWVKNVQDCARLYVACLIDPDVQKGRIFAFPEPFNFDKVLKVLYNLRPDRKFSADFVGDNVRDQSSVTNERAIELLKVLGKLGLKYG
ncbi:hypothetical protein BGZ57DRAFT_939115 [Hyaloscypha finlandica]|nr:hypothetical protein BGZ57DRAFT_939115 [Hyaloscypha finlandica]